MLKPILGEQSSATRRQDVNDAYSLNGAIYVVPVERFIQERKFLYDNSMPFIMDKQSSVDIDDAMDFRIAELILSDKQSR
jgi:CMP-N-acetylneuraminic acid synthetase